MKVCKNCGEQAPDEMLTCPKCGTSLDETVDAAASTENTEETVAPAQDPEPVANPASQVQLEAEPDPEAQKKLKMLILAGAGVVALLVIVLICRSLFSSSYKDPMNKACKLLNKQSNDVQELVDAVLPKFVSTAYKGAIKGVKKFDDKTDSTKYDDFIDMITETMDTYYSDIEDEFGKNAKFSYKITEKEKLSTKELKEIATSYKSYKDTIESLDVVVDSFKEKLKNEYDLKNKEANEICDIAKDVLDGLSKDLKNIEISEGYAVTIEVTIEGADDEDSKDYDINIINVNGKWCVDALSVKGVKEKIALFVLKVKGYAN